MEIAAKLKGDLELKSIKHYAETNARIANVRIHVKLSEERAREVLGQDIADQVFSGLLFDSDDDGNTTWGFKSLVPDVKIAKHVVELDGIGSFGIVPELEKIRPADDGPHVVATLGFPVECSDRKKIGALALKVGDVIDVELKPQQMSLPGVATVEKKAGAHGTAIPMAATSSEPVEEAEDEEQEELPGIEAGEDTPTVAVEPEEELEDTEAEDEDDDF